MYSRHLWCKWDSNIVNSNSSSCYIPVWTHHLSSMKYNCKWKSLICHCHFNHKMTFHHPLLSILPLEKAPLHAYPFPLPKKRAPCRPRRRWRPQPKQGTGRRPPRESRHPSCQQQPVATVPNGTSKTLNVHSRKTNMEHTNGHLANDFAFQRVAF